MAKIKLDMDRVMSVLSIHTKFSSELLMMHKEFNVPKGYEKTVGRERLRIAGYLTIAYMFGAEREDGGIGLKCEVCGHRPFVLLGPQPKNCERCGGELVLHAEVKEGKVCGDCGHFGAEGCPVISRGKFAEAADPVINCEEFKPRKDEKEAEK